jgi:flavodoxin
MTGALVVYDSWYGNTEKIAQAIGSTITGDVKVLRPAEVDPSKLGELNLLIVGSPTQGGRPTKAIQDFLNGFSRSTIKGIKVATFDTRFSTKWVGIFGYAAGKIARSLEKLGGILVVPPEGFFVKGKEGPLKEEETERAASWAKYIGKQSG